MIELTFVGTVVTGLVAWAAFVRPSLLAPLAVAVSSFEATAAIVTPGFGIQPYYLTGVVISVYLVWTLLTKVRSLGRTPGVTSAIVLLGLCLVWSWLGAAVLPIVFEGTPVYAPGRGIDSQVASGTPLQHTTSHLAQSAYLAINVSLVLFVGLAASTQKDVRRLHRAFLISGLIAIVVATVQKVTSTLGVPFPYELIQNNPSMDLRHGVTFRGFVRLSGTFPEASNLAVFGSAFLAYLLTRISGERRDRAFYVLAAALTALVMVWSTSTTAYVMLVLIAAWFVWANVLHPLVRSHGRIWHIPALIAGGIGLLAVLAAAPDVRGVIAESVFGKFDSRSFAVRTRADLDSLALMVSTGGLGVGLGSARPSSFLTALLTNLGIVGTLLWSGAILLLAGHAYRVGVIRGRAAVVALATLVVAKTLSQPDLSSPVLWSLIALCMATITVDAKERGHWLRIAPRPSTGRREPLQPTTGASLESRSHRE